TRRRKGRQINGILVLDKSAGVTSNRALQSCKRLFSAQKAGHTGSLDPLATGVLPICFGEATKFSQYLLDADKCYFSEFQFGFGTTTGDADGDVTEYQSAGHITTAKLLAAINSLLGSSLQVPPMYSAIKQQGQPLYKLARRGEEVAREPRCIHIHRFELVNFVAGEQARAQVQVHCSKGTYIRSLATDLAAALGTVGHVLSLRRSAAGVFAEQQSHTLSALQTIQESAGQSALDKLLLPIDAGITHLPVLAVDESQALALQQGKPINSANQVSCGTVRVMLRGCFMGVAEQLADGQIRGKRLLAANSLV
ncbi:MAG: tRNA pseudouridine(55) synthase TruB, partial [Pseudomonadales bacterium]